MLNSIKKIIVAMCLLFIIPAICFGGENIVGFDLGGVFKDYKNHEEINAKKVFDHAYHVDNVKFFDFAEVETDNDHIMMGLTFIKQYKVSVENLNAEKKVIISDFKMMLKSVEKRYGKFNTNRSDMLNGLFGESNIYFMQKIDDKVINWKPKSKNVGAVFLMLYSDECPDFMIGDPKLITFALMYVDPVGRAKMMKMGNDRTDGF